MAVGTQGASQYYLHNFLTSQPDLNFHNMDVQDALLDVVRFWLDRGVDGFRLDTINFYFADKELRDNPPLSKDQRNASIAPAVNPYNHQDHLFSKNQPENLDFLRRFRAVLDEYGATTAVGEVGDALHGLDIMGQYTDGDDLVHMCYAFEFLSGDSLSADRVVEVFNRLEEAAPNGWACWAFSNHDVVRHTSRWNLSPEAQKLLTTMLMCLRGSVCLYQGEELGLPEADVDFHDLQDPYGIEFWPEFKGRDGCRTPMVWTNSNRNGGFSEARPWLPVAPEHLRLSAEEQEDDPASLLNHYRKAVALRHAVPVLSKGQSIAMGATGTILHFIRKDGNQQIFCAFNLSDAPASLPMPPGRWTNIGADLGAADTGNDATLHLDAWQAVIAEHS